MKKIYIFIAAILTVFCLVALQLIPKAAVSDSTAFELTPSETEYLESLSNREILLAKTSGLMEFKSRDNGDTGLLLPVLRLLREDWGLNVKTADADWDLAFDMINEKKADLMGLAVLNRERREEYYSTGELFAPNMAVYTRIGDPLTNIVNIAGKSVGTLVDSGITGMISEYVSDDTVLREYGGAMEMFKALQDGEIDCVVSAFNIERELLEYPGIRHEMIVESARAPQGLYSADPAMEPLIGIINRYLASPNGATLRSDIENAHEESVLHAARLKFAGEIKDLNENYGELRVYDSGVLYPLGFIDDNDEYKGFQLEVNDVFNKLTGKPIDIRPPSDFEEGFITAINEIKNGNIMGATGVYYNKGYSLDSDFAFSVPVMSDKLGFYAIDTPAGNLSELKIGTTKFGSAYIDWIALTGNEPVIFGDRGSLLDALKRNELDAAFMSEMTVDYYYSVEKDYSLKQISGVVASANFHMLTRAENVSFNKLFNVSIMLQEMIRPYSREQWRNVPRDYKFAFMRVRNRLESYEYALGIIALLLIAALTAMYFTVSYHLKRFAAYDAQISRMLTVQKNADMIWCNTQTGKVVSKGDFPIQRKWQDSFGGKSHFDRESAVNMIRELAKEDLQTLNTGKEQYVCRDVEIISPDDGSLNYSRSYTHKINDHELMAFVLDVTEEKQREKELTKIANIDFISELLTRRAMDAMLTKRTAAYKPGDMGVYIMMFDIDDFKKVNDSYGHDVGDMVLMCIAEIIRTDYSAYPAARWGGEEMLLFAEADKMEDAVLLAEEILDKVEQKIFKVGERTTFCVTMSCGISMLEDANDYPDVVTRADEAMYKAKSDGKNCIRILKR